MELNLPSYPLQIKSEKSKNYVFDPIRKKYVLLSPEEWVRQHLLYYLKDLGYPSGLISVERALPGSTKRYDAVVYGQDGLPKVIVEVKSPSVKLSSAVLDQVSSYLMLLSVPYVLISNGLEHYFLERKEQEIVKFQQIPKFSTLSR